MAVISGTGGGWMDLGNDFDRIAMRAPDTLKKMIEAGAQVYEEQTRRQCARYQIHDTGALEESIKRGPIQRRGDGYRVEVWPQGRRTDERHPNGERNETIAFVIEYGKRSMTARPFMAAAAAAAEPAAAEAMQRILEAENG